MDAKVSIPFKVCTMPGAAHTAGFALDNAHKDKLDEAEEACRPRGQGLVFLPLVVETFGGSLCKTESSDFYSSFPLSLIDDQ